MKPAATSAMPPELFDVLEQLDASCARGAWLGEKLGEGRQGQAFAVVRRDGQPVSGDEATVVVKLYKTVKAWARGGAQDEYDALHLLQKAFQDKTVGSWRLRSPAPLYRSEQPMALVMTKVPGMSINRHLARGDAVSDELFESMAQGVVAALHRFWSSCDRPYGEINLDHILCDPDSSTLSFVDPGMPSSSYLCDGVPRNHYPASRDLANVLFEVAAKNVRTAVTHRSVAARRERFARRVLEIWAARSATGAQRESLFNEIHACATAHLARLKVPSSPAGLWRRHVRWRAARTLRGILVAPTVESARRDVDMLRSEEFVSP